MQVLRRYVHIKGKRLRQAGNKKGSIIFCSTAYITDFVTLLSLITPRQARGDEIYLFGLSQTLGLV